MTKAERARSETRARILKALAHPTRILMVDRLSVKPHCVCELTRIIGADVSTVSKHLSILRHAGLVACVKKGSKVMYSLETPCILRFIGCVEEVAQRTLKGQISTLRLASSRSRL